MYMCGGLIKAKTEHIHTTLQVMYQSIAGL